MASDLEAIAESDAHVQWVVKNHVCNGTERPRCVICDMWWPCDLVSIAARVVLNAASLQRQIDAERERSNRLWGAIKNATDDLETGVEDWGDLAEVRRNYRIVLSDLKAALAAPAERRGGEAMTYRACCHCDGRGKERNGDTCVVCGGTCCSYHYKAVDPSCSSCRIA